MLEVFNGLEFFTLELPEGRSLSSAGSLWRLLVVVSLLLTVFVPQRMRRSRVATPSTRCSWWRR